MLRCAATVEKSAAIIDATTTPNQPAGTFVSIAEYAMSPPTSAGSTVGNAFWMSDSCGKTISEQAPTTYHGHGRIT